MRLVPGVLVANRYRIEQELGRGGMGSVWVAYDTKFEERVAIKVAAASGAAHEEFRRRFTREARIGHRLGRLPGFVRAIDWGELSDGISLYLAMDLVQNARPLDLSSGSREERLERLLEASRLVATAHEHGIVHRDLKPANFLQAPGGIHLTDFGLAKTSDEDPESRAAISGELTQTGVGLGTPHFMAPEQFDDAKTADERSDVYSLGVMLFKALTGDYPYPGTKVMVIWNTQEKVRDGRLPAPRPRAVDPSVEPALDALCAEAISLDRVARPSSASFVARLAAALSGEVRTPAGDPEADSLALTAPPGATVAPPGPPPEATPVAAGPVAAGPVVAQTAQTGGAIARAPSSGPPSAAAATDPGSASGTSILTRPPSWVWKAVGCCAAPAVFGVCCLSGFLLDAGGVQGERHARIAPFTAMVNGLVPDGVLGLLDTRKPELSLETPDVEVDWTTLDRFTLGMRVKDTALKGLALVVRTDEGKQELKQPFPANSYMFESERTFLLPKPGRYSVQVQATDVAGQTVTRSHEIWRVTDARSVVQLWNGEHTATRARAIRVRGRLKLRLVDSMRLGDQRIPVDEDGKFSFRLKLRRGRETYRLVLRSPRGQELVRTFDVTRLGR